MLLKSYHILLKQISVQLCYYTNMQLCFCYKFVQNTRTIKISHIVNTSLFIKQFVIKRLVYNYQVSVLCDVTAVMV